MNFSKLSGFEEDPNELIIKLYELRNPGLIPKSSHHLIITTTMVTSSGPVTVTTTTTQSI